MNTAELLVTVAEKEQEIQDKIAEMDNALGEAVLGGSADGKTINELWWDVHTYNNERNGYLYGFAYADFTPLGGFNPPYQIKVKGTGSHTFHSCRGIGVLRAKDIDFSECTDFTYMCDRAGITEIELIDTRASNALNGLFNQNNYTVTVHKLILKEDGSQTFSKGAFESAYKMNNITFEGAIGADIWFTYSPLNLKSLQSVIKALKNYKDTGTTHTVMFSDSSISLLSDAEKAKAIDKGWTILNKSGQAV